MVSTKRVRDSNGDIAQLNLEAAADADRELVVLAASDHRGKTLKGFYWVKSTAQASTIQVFKRDSLNSSLDYLLEERVGDTSTSGNWKPPEEEMTGFDVQRPDLINGFAYVIRFGQTAGACLADVHAEYKAV